MKHKHADLIKAWADGAKIEQGVKCTDGTITWHTPKVITWRDNNIYRIKVEKAQEKCQHGHIVV